MLRALAVLLLVANLVFYGWSRGWLDVVVGVRAAGDREPERLALQVRPERVVILPAAGGKPIAAAATPGAHALCLEAGPFDAAAAASAAATLASALPGVDWADVKVATVTPWTIDLGPDAARDAPRRRDDELRRSGIESTAVELPGERGAGLAIGRYGDRDSAEQALAELLQRGTHGIRGARPLELSAASTVHLLRIEKADPALAAQLAALKADTLGRGFVACGGTPAARQASG